MMEREKEAEGDPDFPAEQSRGSGASGRRQLICLLAARGPTRRERNPHRLSSFPISRFFRREFGQLIINATNGFGTLPALEAAGKNNLVNKVMIDISNPLDFSKGMPPSLFISNTDSLGEQIQRNYPELKVVKALNTMNAYIMVKPALLPDDHNVFLNGE